MDPRQYDLFGEEFECWPWPGSSPGRLAHDKALTRVEEFLSLSSEGTGRSIRSVPLCERKVRLKGGPHGS